MVAFDLQYIALWLPRLMIDGVLMLFGFERGHLNEVVEIVITGLVALTFWSWLIRKALRKLGWL